MLNILLLVLGAITYFTGETAADQGGAFIILGMVVLSVTLRFLQEMKADNAAQKLKAMVTVTATVIRAG